MARLNRIKVLADAVAASFELAGFTPAELLQGPIVVTDAAWQAPPIKCPGLLQGVPFSEYVDYPLPVDSERLFEFYSLGVLLLKNGPEDITNEDGYKALSKIITRSKPGERNLCFPLFENWPVGDHNTGAMFAMEAARLFMTSSDSVEAMQDDESNYWVKTPWGQVGVVDGYVAGGKQVWDVDCRGFVQGLLEQPRGRVTVTCLYDTIARLRSALYQEPHRFNDFEVLDTALQALRILSDGQTCRELNKAVEQMSVLGFKRKLKITAYSQALDVMSSWNLTDRVKISMLQEILMPQYMSLAEFSRKILDPHRVFPAVLSQKTETRILAVLQNELKKLSHSTPKPKEPS